MGLGATGLAQGQGAMAQPQMSEGNEASPEEQRQYDMMMENAGRVLYAEGRDEPVSANVMASLKGSDEPVLNLATTAVTLVTQLKKSAGDAGMEIGSAALMEAGADIVGMLAEVAEVAGIHDYSQEEIDGAWFTALDMYREAEAPESETLKQEFDQIVEADRQGRLNDLLPNLPMEAASGPR